MACVIPGPPPRLPMPMTTPAERAKVYFANALLPAPLPTPPRCKMVPLLPTPCLVLLPVSPPPKPSRADADERWDARKTAAAAVKKPSPPASVSVPRRADAVERWDAHKVKRALTTSSSSSSSSNSNSPTSRLASSSSSQKWSSSRNKKRAVSRAPSAQERRDSHRQQPKAREIDDDGSSSTGSNDMDVGTPPRQALYAGAGFGVSAPEPAMLPTPSSFLVRVG